MFIFHVCFFVYRFFLETLKDEILGEKCWKRVENLFNQNRVVVGFSGFCLFFLSFCEQKLIQKKLQKKGNGNEEDNCNYDMYSNAPLRITVGAHEPGGEPSLFTETCASVVFFNFSFLFQYYYFLCLKKEPIFLL